MRILKCRSQLTIAFFAAVNYLILTDLLANKTLLHGFKRSWFVICGFRSVLCFSVSRFVACDRNYDWRQRKTQLWRWLLKFRVCMFAKSACKVSVQSEAPESGGINGQLAVCFSILLAPVVQTLDSAIQRINHYPAGWIALSNVWTTGARFSYNTIFLSSVNQLRPSHLCS